MKTMMVMAGLALLTGVTGCQSRTEPAAYANPVDACANKATEAERDACMKNVVADVRLSVQREAERKPPR